MFQISYSSVEIVYTLHVEKASRYYETLMATATWNNVCGFSRITKSLVEWICCAVMNINSIYLASAP